MPLPRSYLSKKTIQGNRFLLNHNGILKRSCPHCSGIISAKSEDRLSRYLESHIRKLHPEKFSVKIKEEVSPSLEKSSKEQNQESETIEGAKGDL